MALSKLKVQQIDREKLYFNQYSLRGMLTTPHLYYAHSANSISRYRAIIKETQSFQYNWRGKVIESDIDYALVEKIIEFKNRHKTSKTAKFRYELDKLCVYTNDPAILEQMAELCPDAEFTQILLSPAGTKYFKIDPPAKYRVYLKNKQINEGLRDTLLEFFKRDLAKPCFALRDSLKGKNSWRWAWIKNSYSIDYDDETTLSYMGLMFPELLGKTYKLEKKQG